MRLTFGGFVSRVIPKEKKNVAVQYMKEEMKEKFNDTTYTLDLNLTPFSRLTDRRTDDERKILGETNAEREQCCFMILLRNIGTTKGATRVKRTNGHSDFSYMASMLLTCRRR